MKEEKIIRNISDKTYSCIKNFEIPKMELDFFNYEIIDFEKIINEKYLVIGNDYGTKICVDITTDNIVSVDFENNRFIFVNLNLEKFIKFIDIMNYNMSFIIEATDESIKNILLNIRSGFNEIDKSALESDTNWWSLILEQIEDGLL